MKKYIFYAPPYDENIGGVIAIHRLCDLLNKLGYEAFLWRYNEDHLFKTNENFNTPTLYTKELNDFIVIYMEIVAGNPLNAPNVIRWFLNKPGFFTGEIKYGKNEQYFYFQKTFNDTNINQDMDNQLYITYFNDAIYKQNNFNEREGSCYLIRKGKNRKIVHDIENSMQIDGLSHGQIASIFNEKKYFYCYDLYSAYTFFAIMCGCIPIVMPEENISASQWHSDEYLRYGIAYGIDDIEYVYKTKHKINETLNILEKKAKQDVNTFITKSQAFFKHTYKTQQMIKEERLDYIDNLTSASNKIVFFGASESLSRNVYMLEYNNVKPDYICDNSKSKHGTYFKGNLIHDPEALFDLEEQFDVLITSMYVQEIKEQLKKYSNVKEIYSIYS